MENEGLKYKKKKAQKSSLKKIGYNRLLAIWITAKR